MASMLRNVTIIARGGNDLKDVDFMGKNDPYLVMELEGQRVETEVDKNGGENPIWDQTFRFVLPQDEPDAEAPALRVSVKNSTRLLPDKEIGSGSMALSHLLRGDSGSQEVRVPIVDKRGREAGWVMLAVDMTLGEQDHLGSAAGTTLGTSHTPTGGVVDTALPPGSQKILHEVHPIAPSPAITTQERPLTTAPMVGPTAGVGSGPGSVMNPSSPGFGANM